MPIPLRTDFDASALRSHGKHPTKAAFRIAAPFGTVCLFPGIAAVS